MPSIVIMNAKGGVGKSTLTMAFAETMATYQDARCLLIDADGQMSLSLMLADGMRLAQQSNSELTIVPLFQQLVLDGFSSVDWRNFILQGVSDVDTAEKIHLLTGSMD
jgi:chromosome partitioning protein